MLFIRIIILCFTLISAAQAETILTDLEGHQIQFSSLKGKWVIFNYWASWCHACLNEISALNQFYAKNQSTMALYAVNYDAIPLEDQKELVKKYGLAYPSLRSDPGDSLALGDIIGVPATFIFNPQGRLVKTLYGEQTLARLNDVFSRIAN